MAFFALLSLALPLIILYVIRDHVIDSHKENKFVWLYFYIVIFIAFIAFNNVTNVVFLATVLIVLVLLFLAVSYKAVIKAVTARKFNLQDSRGHHERRLSLAKSKFITDNIALAMAYEYINLQNNENLLVLTTVAGNPKLKKEVMKHFMTINLPNKVYVALANNKAVTADILTVLTVKDGVNEDVFDAILDNKNTTTDSIRNIISLLDDPYSLIDGGSPQSDTAEKAVTILKKRNPELNEIDKRYIIASCSTLF